MKVKFPLALLFMLAPLGTQAAARAASSPIEITKGGTYSGRWISNDPKIAAVTIRTDEPVVLRDATVSGRGNLIYVLGGKNGANVTVENVTGTAMDPGVAGTARGAFLAGGHFNALTVDHCTMTGMAFGVKVAASNPTVLRITNNRAEDLEDRASDGHGGLLQKRALMGHFVLLDHTVAVQGAEIGWNQSVQTMGTTSTEDVINIYESTGSREHPIRVHDNYLEGASTAVPGKNYTGTALIVDGNSVHDAQPGGWIVFENNQIVATAGTGIGIAYGHDITARNNRVVSCGVDARGHAYAWGASAAVIWNYYKAPGFYNNTITGTSGGMVGPGSSGKPRPMNEWMMRDGSVDASSAIHNNTFTDPCIVDGKVNLQAEAQERMQWNAKLKGAHQTVGARAAGSK